MKKHKCFHINSMLGIKQKCWNKLINGFPRLKRRVHKWFGHRVVDKSFGSSFKLWMFFFTFAQLLKGFKGTLLGITLLAHIFGLFWEAWRESRLDHEKASDYEEWKWMVLWLCCIDMGCKVCLWSLSKHVYTWLLVLRTTSPCLSWGNVSNLDLLEMTWKPLVQLRSVDCYINQYRQATIISVQWYNRKYISFWNPFLPHCLHISSTHASLFSCYF